MEPTVYHFSGAPYAWRVLLALQFKGVAYHGHLLSVSRKEHKTPEFLALNPRGTIPVLVAGDTVLRDSIACLAWLDRAYPEVPLFGTTADQAATIWQMVTECNDYLRAATDQMLRGVFASDGAPPPPGSAEAERMQAGAAAMHREYETLEAHLADGRLFLAGDAPSAADTVAYPEVRLLQRASETRPEVMKSLGFEAPAALYPMTVAWKDRLNAMPEVAATMPGHWSETQTAA